METCDEENDELSQSATGFTKFFSNNFASANLMQLNPEDAAGSSLSYRAHHTVDHTLRDSCHFWIIYHLGNANHISPYLKSVSVGEQETRKLK